MVGLLIPVPILVMATIDCEYYEDLAPVTLLRGRE